MEQLNKEGKKLRESFQQKAGQLQQKENELNLKEEEMGRLHVELQQRNDKILQMNEDIKHKASQINAIQNEIEVSNLLLCSYFSCNLLIEGPAFTRHCSRCSY